MYIDGQQKSKTFHMFWKGNIYKYYSIVSIPALSLSVPFCLFFLLFCGLSQMSYAHGDLDERIAEVTQEIEVTSDSAFLYFKRGKLYFQHEEYSDVINDLNQAASLGYQDQLCDLLYARSYQKLGNYDKGMDYIDKVLKEDDSKVVALKIKASILFDQKKYQTAALFHEKVIDKSIRTLPDNYLSASKAWELLETEEGNIKAIKILEKGLKDLGPLFSFYHQIRELHLANNSYQKALEVQKIIIKNSDRKETGFFKAAEICMLSKDKNQAKNYLKYSLDALQKLPPRVKGNKSMKILKSKIENKQKQLIENQPR